MKWPTTAEALFSAKSFAAGMLALYLAMRIGLPRPFWSLLTAYVVAQPLSGAVRSKAMYRFLGTLIGAAFAVIATPRLANYSVLLTLALAVWLGTCLYISLLDRTPRSYIFMLAGYTPILIGIPALVDTSAFNALTMFDTALARVEEISLGVGCAALVHGLILPQSIGPVVLKRMDQALEDAQSWIQQALLHTNASQNAANHRKLAQDITDLRLMSTHLPFDTSNLKWTANTMRVLQDRLSSIVLFMTSIEDRLEMLRAAHDGKLPPSWQLLLEDIAAWCGTGIGNSAESAIQLRRRIADMTPTVDGNSSWIQILEVNLLAHLGKLMDTCENCFHQRQQIRLGLDGIVPTEQQRLDRIPTRELHADRGLALMSGFSAAMAMCASSAFWILSGWPLGFAAPMMAGMFCAFFSTLDNPVPALKIQLICTALSSIFTGIYLLWLLPSAHSFEMLMLVMAPFLLTGGIFLARPSTILYAVPLCFTPLASLMMFDMGTSDMTSFINSQISQVIGIGISVLCTSLFRSVNAEWVAQRLLRAAWNEIVQLAEAVRVPSMMAVTVRMVDRVSLLLPRLAASRPGDDIAAIRALQDLRVGMNMSHLLRVRARLERRTVSIQPLLGLLSDHFRHRSDDFAARKQELLAAIDQTLHAICGAGPFPMRNEAVAALAGIRRDLFPQAIPYQPVTTPYEQLT
ncbi:MAG: aaeB 3 [Burkholderiaceae bacterium]|nr:aaeB 3 [Burkholderiaceae bacterium]